MPFVTEELWHAQGERPYELIVAKWPEPEAAIDAAAKAEVEWLIELVSAIRSARTEINVPPSARTDIYVLTTPYAAFDPSALPTVPTALIARFRRNLAALHKLARIDEIDFLNTGTRINASTRHDISKTVPSTAPAKTLGPQLVVDDITYILPIEGVIDIAAEQARLAKAREAALKERDSLAKRLENPAFVEKARPEAVEKARADHAHHAAEADRLEAALARLG